MTEKQKELAAKFGTSKDGNFYPVDTIGVPHPYCITPRHVSYAADYCSGLLGKSAIEGAERDGAHCGMRNCTLAFDQHEQALVIACKLPLNSESGKTNAELFEYLQSIKDIAEKEHFAGFAFLDARGK
jgi:hypothetical protein